MLLMPSKTRWRGRELSPWRRCFFTVSRKHQEKEREAQSHERRQLLQREAIQIAMVLAVVPSSSLHRRGSDNSAVKRTRNGAGRMQKLWIRGFWHVSAL